MFCYESWSWIQFMLRDCCIWKYGFLCQKFKTIIISIYKHTSLYLHCQAIKKSLLKTLTYSNRRLVIWTVYTYSNYVFVFLSNGNAYGWPIFSISTYLYIYTSTIIVHCNEIKLITFAFYTEEKILPEMQFNSNLFWL